MANRFVATVLLLLLVSTSTRAETMKPTAEPIVITANKLTADNKEKTALFEGSVHVKRGDVHMHADKMKVYYTDEQKGSSVTKIEASGSVKLIRNRSILTADNALYLLEPEEMVIFTGQPRASDGGNVVTGTKMTYFIKDDRSVVEGSKVFINSSDRVRLR